MLAPEAGVWIDGWMPGQITALGRGNSDLDTFIQTELKNILLNYGSHASCCMMAIGNELGNSDFEIMRQWMIDINNLSMRGFEEKDNYKNRLFSISTARSNVTPAADNAYFQWTVYQSFNGNYYLYNIGKQKFLGIQSANNTDIPLVDTPASKTLTFKQSNSTEYPIMFSTDNAGVVNHSGNHGEGLITWTGGWETLNDAGSNHKVKLITKLEDAELAKIADLAQNDALVLAADAGFKHRFTLYCNLFVNTFRTFALTH